MEHYQRAKAAATQTARAVVRRLNPTAEERQIDMEMKDLGKALKKRKKEFRVEEQEPFQLAPEDLVEELKRPLFSAGPRQKNLREMNVKEFYSQNDVAEKFPRLQININEPLGEGSFGVVYGGTFRDKNTRMTKQVAVKTCKMRTSYQRGTPESYLVNEILYWGHISGYPFITMLIDYMKVGEEVWFVAERANAGDLHYAIQGQPHRRFELVVARYFFRQIASAVNYMHGRCIAHRDLKLENVLLVRESEYKFTAKVSDFGLSTIAWTLNSGVYLQNNFCGTLMYVPPELIFQQFGAPKPFKVIPQRPEGETIQTPVPSVETLPVHRRVIRDYVHNVQPGMVHTTWKQSFRDYYKPEETNAMNGDNWALGVILFVLVTGKYPFHRGEDDTEGLGDMMAGRVVKLKIMPQMCREFIRQMLEPDPQKRIPTRCIINHDWLKDNPPNREDRHYDGLGEQYHRVPPEDPEAEPVAAAAAPALIAAAPVVVGAEYGGARPKVRSPQSVQEKTSSKEHVAEVYVPKLSSGAMARPQKAEVPKFPFQDLTKDDHDRAAACLLDRESKISSIGPVFESEAVAITKSGICVIPDSDHALIAKGEQSAVYKAMRTGDLAAPPAKQHLLTFFALKKMPIQLATTKAKGRTPRQIHFEVNLLSQLCMHESIIEMSQAMVIERENHQPYAQIVLELADAGNLKMEMDRQEHKRFIEPQAREYLNQIVQGLYFLHRSGVCHRNLTMQNVLLKTEGEKKHCKISGFGKAATCWTTTRGLFLLSDFPVLRDRNFAAPELVYHLSGKPDLGDTNLQLLREYKTGTYAGIPVDVWSIGVMVYFMLTGSPPYETSALPIGIERILRGDFVENDSLSSDTENFLWALMNVQPNNRLLTDRLMQHIWMKKKGFSVRKRVQLTLPPLEAYAAIPRNISAAEMIPKSKSAETPDILAAGVGGVSPKKSKSHSKPAGSGGAAGSGTNGK